MMSLGYPCVSTYRIPRVEIPTNTHEHIRRVHYCSALKILGDNVMSLC